MDPKHAQRLVNQGIDIVASTAAVLKDYLKAEIGKWGQVIQAAGISPQ